MARGGSISTHGNERERIIYSEHFLDGFGLEVEI